MIDLVLARAPRSLVYYTRAQGFGSAGGDEDIANPLIVSSSKGVGNVFITPCRSLPPADMDIDAVISGKQGDRMCPIAVANVRPIEHRRGPNDCTTRNTWL